MTDLRAKKLAVAALLLMAILWGSSFVVTKDALDRLPVFDLLALRYTIALGVLVALAWKHVIMDARTAIQGLVMGVLFALGQVTQTVGLSETHASVSGFLTGTYVVFTPLLASALFRSRIGRNVWWAIGFAVLGLGVLSIVPGEGLALGPGELLTIFSALAFAGHIIATGRFATPHNAMNLTLVQTAVIAATSWALALPDGLVLPSGTNDWVAVLYLAVIAGAATLFLQNWAQAHVEPTKAAVVMCSEPVWAAFFAVAFGFEPLTWQMVLGGAAIVIAMYVVVRPPVLRLPSILAAEVAIREHSLDHRRGARPRDRRILCSPVDLEAALHQRA